MHLEKDFLQFKEMFFCYKVLKKKSNKFFYLISKNNVQIKEIFSLIV